MVAFAERTVSRVLADAMHATRYASLPRDVVAHAHDLMLDTRMVALAGARQPDVVALTAQARRIGGVAESGIWGCGGRVPAAEAAFVNALAASALDYDSLHQNVHPDAIALSASWAVAEAAHCSGRELLRAFILGSELICRLADAVEGPQKGWTIGAVLGTFGAAAASALLLDLSPEQITHALGFCLSTAAGSQQANVEQVLAKRLQPAFAARAGVHAAFLAQIGLTAPSEVFEGRFGLWKLYFPADAGRVLDRFGDSYALLRTGLKRYPVCACSHAAIEALRTAMNDGAVDASDIERIDVVISPFMDRLVGGAFDPSANPQVTAQFSLRYAVSSIALRGDLGIAQLAAQAVCDPAIAEFERRVAVSVDDANSGELAPAIVRLRAKSGRLIERRIDHMPGGPEAILSDEQRHAKYVECAAIWDASCAPFILDDLRRQIADLDRTQDVARR